LLAAWKLCDVHLFFPVVVEGEGVFIFILEVDNLVVFLTLWDKPTAFQTEFGTDAGDEWFRKFYIIFRIVATYDAHDSSL